jgi:hypothetical protein
MDEEERQGVCFVDHSNDPRKEAPEASLLGFTL